jgi:polysaccharide biosynthesis/export protein
MAGNIVVSFVKNMRLALVSAVSLMATGLAAQQVDIEALKRLQSQVGGSSPTEQSSPLDRARERAATSGLRTGDTPISDDLKDQLEAAKLRREIQQYAPATPIERSFRDRTGVQTLRQFGYDLLAVARNTSTLPVTGDVGDGYVMGVGDEVVVMFQGSTSRNITTRIDREGRLVVDQLRPIIAAGRSFGAVRRDVEAATRATLLGTDVYLSIGTVRAVSVLVGGEVNRPGAFNVTSLTDVASVLAQAGGVRTTGSLRRVRLVRAGQVINYDVYGLLGIGNPPSLRLRDGDRIVVPAIGQVLAIAGGVARPGIYELAPGGRLSIAQAIAIAGGPLRPNGNDFIVNRIGKNGDEIVLNLNTPGASLQAGDAVIVSPRVRGTEGQIRVSGYVDTPGVRSLGSARSVAALLGSADNLKAGVYLPFAALVRDDPRTRAKQYQAVNLVNIFSRGENLNLRSGDELVLFSENDISFLQSEAVRRVILGERNPEPKCRALVAFETVVRDTQSQRFSAAIRGSFLVDRNGKAEVASGAGSQSQLGVTDTDALIGGSDTLRRTKNDRFSNDLETTQRRDETQQLQNDQFSEQPKILTEFELSERALRDNKKCPDIFSTRPELMGFLLEHSVSLNGAVRKPGAYPLAGNADVATLLAVGNGLTVDALKETVEVTRSEGTVARVETVALQNQRMSDIRISAGDDVRFKSGAQALESGAILLSGEFLRPGLYPIRKGEKLSELIERAGGVSDNAYAYGAVFTRRSVRLAQQQGFQRTARELNTALINVTARKNINAEGILAATQLANSFAKAEAPGRMVVEADPRVLNVRKDLDTVLEPGDAIFMPKRPNFILAVGDFLNPSALQFIPQKTLDSYIAESGGLQRSADKSRIFVVYPNGVARQLKKGAWRQAEASLPPGSTIIVPKNIDPLAKLDIIKDVASIIGQLAVSFASIAVIAR